MLKNKKQDNYLDKKPTRTDVPWKSDENGNVTLSVENKGIINKFAQICLNKPKVSYIHLDELGSYIWKLLDGKKDISEIGVIVKEYFGDKAEPLYERLSKYIKTLEGCKFITYK